MRMKHDRIVIVLIVVGLVALSGCAGGGDDTASEATSTVTETGTPAMNGGADTTPTRTMSADNGVEGFTPSSHAAALRDAGSYTVTFAVSGAGGQGGMGMSTFEGTQRVDLESGAWYMRMTTAAQGNMSIEYYGSPDSETVYQNTMGAVQEMSTDSAMYFNVTNPGTGMGSAGSWPGFSEAGSGETDLGSATRYVVDSIDALPAETQNAYGSIENLSYEVWVDDDTGVIARYEYSLEYAADGESGSVQIRYNLRDLGSTTVEEPDWLP